MFVSWLTASKNHIGVYGSSCLSGDLKASLQVKSANCAQLLFVRCLTSQQHACVSWDGSTTTTVRVTSSLREVRSGEGEDGAEKSGRGGGGGGRE